MVSPGSGIASFAALQPHIAQVGVYSVVTLGADQVWIYNVSAFELGANNFLFF